MKTRILQALCLTLVLGLYQPRAAQGQTILSLVQGNTNLDVLEAAVVRASTGSTDVATLLNSAGTFTVFAPSDAAFISFLGAADEAAAITAINALAADDVRDILLYHLLDTEVLTTGLAIPSRTTRVTESALGTRVFLWRNAGAGDRVTVNGAELTTKDIDATNGVVHIINAVLVEPDQDLVAEVAGNFNFDVLEAAVVRAGLVTTLQSTSATFTLFAPTDAAFITFLGAGNEAAAITAINATDSAALARILLTHVLPTVRYSTDALAGPGTTAQAGESLIITAAPLGVRADGNAASVPVVADFDVQATNGVIHTVGTVLNPTGTLLAEVANNANLDVLEAAVTRASTGTTDVTSLLSSPGNLLTLFAPDDAAFISFLGAADEAAAITAINALGADAVRDILLYHLLGNGNEVTTTGLAIPSRTTQVTQSAATTRVFLWRNAGAGDRVTVNGAELTSKDVDAVNGVLHVINRVLAEPTQNVVEEVVGRSNLEVLEAAVIRAGLLDDLSNATGTFTLFSPTDAAFTTFFSVADETAAITAVNAQDSATLAGILLTHVFGNVRYSSDALAGPGTTLQTGETLVITASPLSVQADNNAGPVAIVTPFDIQTTNGVIHYIGTVLDPGTVTSNERPRQVLTGLQIAPNPVSDVVTVRGVVERANLPVVARLYGLDGKVVGEGTFQPAGDGFVDGAISVAGKANGVYLLYLVQGDQAVTLRAVKE